MRIGIDATPLPSQPVGAGTYIIELVRALAELNSDHQFVVFAHHSRLSLFGDCPNQLVQWISVKDKPPALRFAWEQIMLPGLANRLDLDILHSLHYTSPRKLGCASVVTFHDMTFFLYPQFHTLSKRWLFPIMIRSSARTSTAIAVVSETTRRDTIKILNVPPGKIHTTPNGISPAFRKITDSTQMDACRKKYNLPEKFILYLGTIEPRKNLPLLLRAYHQFVQENTSHPLVIAGKRGWMYDQVLETVKKLRLETSVYFTGYIAREDLPVIYNLAEVLVYPSIYEGFGLPPLEAMACGTPVIVTEISTNQEHVGEAGFYFPPEDEMALVQALRTLLNNPDLQADLSGRGRERARQFTWQNCARATLEMYQKVASS
jgi:glycosyltransferase involved in cell wall biosynthesis